MNYFPQSISKPKPPDEEFGLEPHAFESLERDFQELLHKLAGDQSLEHF